MSLINKVLQDLDRRDALTTPRDSDPNIRPSKSTFRSSRLAVVLVVAAAAIAAGTWAWQKRPSKSVSERAFQPVVAQKKPAPPAPTAAMATPPAPPKPAQESSPAPPPKPAVAAAEQPAPEPAPEASTRRTAPAHARHARAPASRPAASRGAPALTQAAQHQYENAVALLNEGRVSEAENELLGALRLDSSYAPARQAYIALLLEQGRIDRAQRELIDTLSSDPTQPVFALALSRIYAKQRDYAAALEVMDKAGPAAAGADFEYLRGMVLARMGRHAEAVDAYRKALAVGGDPGAAWVGLAISLDRLLRRDEAAEAYRRALAAGSLGRELQNYAEARLRELQ